MLPKEFLTFLYSLLLLKLIYLLSETVEFVFDFRIFQKFLSPDLFFSKRLRQVNVHAARIITPKQ